MTLAELKARVDKAITNREQLLYYASGTAVSHREAWDHFKETRDGIVSEALIDLAHDDYGTFEAVQGYLKQLLRLYTE